MTKWITVSSAAKRLKVVPQTILNWIKKHKIETKLDKKLVIVKQYKKTRFVDWNGIEKILKELNK